MRFPAKEKNNENPKPTLFVGAPLVAVSDSRCLRHGSPAIARAADGERGGASGSRAARLLAARGLFT